MRMRATTTNGQPAYISINREINGDTCVVISTPRERVEVIMDIKQFTVFQEYVTYGMEP